MLICSVVAAIEKCKKSWSPCNVYIENTTYWFEDIDEFRDIEYNSVFASVGFNREGWFSVPSDTEDPFNCDGYLMDEDFDPSNPYWEKDDHLLREHPLVLHSFASFPPVARLRTAYGREQELEDVLWDFPLPVGEYDVHEGITIKHIVENVLSQ